MSLVQTYAGLVRIISGLVKKGCCCGPPCGEYALSINVSPQSCCCFDFSFSLDPPGATTIVSQLWNFGDGATSTSASPSHCYDEAGTYAISLTTVDAEGCIKIATGEVTCGSDCPEGEGPVADFDYQQTSECCFDFDDQSTVGGDCEGRTIVSWAWAFGDGNTSTSQNPSHCYSGAGPWNVTLTVTDNFGCVDSVVMSVACVDFYACADNDCNYPAPSTATMTLAGFSDIAGAPTCPECSDLNGITLSMTNATSDGCVWDCGGACVACGDGPTLCATYPDVPSPGFPGNHPVEIIGTLEVVKLGPSNYRIEASVAINSCRNGTAQAALITWRLDGLTTCPRGSYSVPYAASGAGSVNNVCEHDLTSAITVDIP